MMPVAGFITITLSKSAAKSLRDFHALLVQRGIDTIPAGIDRPDGPITISKAVEILAAIGHQAVTARSGGRTKR
jgi:hypothetical protein